MTMVKTNERVKLALVGGGIMSATLAALVRELMPDLSTAVFERLHKPAFESTQAMNNAGTGHAGNYLRVELHAGRQRRIYRHRKGPHHQCRFRGFATTLVPPG